MGFVDRDQWKRSIIEDVTRILAAGVSTASLELATAKFFGEPARGAEQRALNTRVAFLRDMDSWRELDCVLGVEIKRSPTGGCEQCGDVLGCWKKDEAPVMPYERCTTDLGCLCWWAAIFEGEGPPSPWRSAVRSK